MGKSWKTRSHLNTGYPYNPVRAGGLQVPRPRPRAEDDALYLGMYGEAGHPVFSREQALGPHAPGDLKHLAFLRAYGEFAAAKLAGAYSSSRACLPAVARQGLCSLEGRVQGLGQPLLAGLQSGGQKVLWNLDAKVDAVVQALHPKSLEAGLEDSLALVRERGIGGAARTVVQALLRRLDETCGRDAADGGDSLALTAGDGADAWPGRLAHHPTVSRLLERAQPGLDLAQRKYAGAHDAVVASAAYSRTVEAAAEVLQRVADSALYRLAAERLYPAISGIADPALDRLANSPTAKAVLQHLKPQAPPRAAAEPAAPVCAVAC